MTFPLLGGSIRFCSVTFSFVALFTFFSLYIHEELIQLKKIRFPTHPICCDRIQKHALLFDIYYGVGRATRPAYSSKMLQSHSSLPGSLYRRLREPRLETLSKSSFSRIKSWKFSVSRDGVILLGITDVPR